jgi:hypothetical protein
MDHAGRRDLFSFPFRALPAVMDAIILAERQRSIPFSDKSRHHA